VIRALVITTVETVQADVRDIEPSLDGFQAIVGGWLEGIGGDDWRGYCDEEGKIKGLPVNVRATRLARLFGWPSGDLLCGPVVFVGPPDEEGEDTDLPGLVEVVARSLGYVD
jgi:hypothetical protein